LPLPFQKLIVSQLLTGATGALGANIINVLCKDTSVSKILCLVRAEDQRESKTRVDASLSLRKISASDTDYIKLQCIPFRLDKANLGLSADTLQQIKIQVTSFIHVSISEYTYLNE
jgi:thioester reductase-like protein